MNIRQHYISIRPDLWYWFLSNKDGPVVQIAKSSIVPVAVLSTVFVRHKVRHLT